MTYLEKLKDPRWQKKRLEVLQRDNWICQNCGAADKSLHVHHWCYAKGRDPWDYPPEELTTLCEECHEAERAEREDVEASIIETFVDCHFFCDDIMNLAALIYSETITRQELTARRHEYWEKHSGPKTND